MLHRLHRFSACVIGSFIVLHLANHLVAVGGVQAHIDLMDSLRRLYRLPVIEVLLLVCVVFQVSSGLWFIKSRWGQRAGFFERLQVISGGYLAFFLLVHVGAVLSGRWLFGLDTNYYFAAAGMHLPPFQLFFVPYYFLAVVAIFAHVACGLYWLSRNRLAATTRKRLAISALLVGIVLAAIIVASFAGAFYEVNVPAEYLDSYR